MSHEIDIKENELIRNDKQLLSILLKDHTTKQNIIWATDNYEPLGEGYGENEPIAITAISGENGTIIRPRVSKTKAEQLARSRNKAEVFTPSWVCNCQNNVADKGWFETEEDLFNTEITKGWTRIDRAIPFPPDKTWQSYIKNTCLEITCGEAPYLASRYDTISGVAIPIPDRIGLLDRKLRVIDENVTDEVEWRAWAKVAFQNIYGFEWQGDSIILARENLLYTYLDYYEAKFGGTPPKADVREIANIISWNIWQMDGLKGVIPNSCHSTTEVITDLFGGTETKVHPCKGCRKIGEFKNHNGIYCKIKDWETGGTILFVSLLKK